MDIYQWCLTGLLKAWWCGHLPVVSNWFIKRLVVFKTIYGYVYVKDILESIEKSMGLCHSPSKFSVSPICP